MDEIPNSWFHQPATPPKTSDLQMEFLRAPPLVLDGLYDEVIPACFPAMVNSDTG